VSGCYSLCAMGALGWTETLTRAIRHHRMTQENIADIFFVYAQQKKWISKWNWARHDEPRIDKGRNRAISQCTVKPRAADQPSRTYATSVRSIPAAHTGRIRQSRSVEWSRHDNQRRPAGTARAGPLEQRREVEHDCKTRILRSRSSWV